MLNDMLNDMLNGMLNDMLNDAQHGFGKGRSCLSDVFDNILNYLSEDNATSVDMVYTLTSL